MGGYPRLRGTLRRLKAALADTARLDRLRGWLRSWLTKGSCSGHSLKSSRDGERIVLDLPPRKRARVVQQVRAVVSGIVVDRSSRWAVQDIFSGYVGELVSNDGVGE